MTKAGGPSPPQKKRPNLMDLAALSIRFVIESRGFPNDVVVGVRLKPNQTRIAAQDWTVLE